MLILMFLFDWDSEADFKVFPKQIDIFIKIYKSINNFRLLFMVSLIFWPHKTSYLFTINSFWSLIILLYKK